MSLRQLGEAMDIQELTVIWPQFFAYRAREAERQKQKAENRRRR